MASDFYRISGDTLRGIGDSIRARDDTTAEIGAEDMPLRIRLIPGGMPEKSVLCTITREMSLKEVLTAYPVPFHIQNGVVFLEAVSDQPPTKSSVTSNYCAFFIADGSSAFMFLNYVNGLVPINDLNIHDAITGSYGASSFSAQDGFITNTGGTALRYFPAGTVFKTWEVATPMPKQ